MLHRARLILTRLCDPAIRHVLSQAQDFFGWNTACSQVREVACLPELCDSIDLRLCPCHIASTCQSHGACVMPHRSDIGKVLTRRWEAEDGVRIAELRMSEIRRSLDR